MLGQAWLIQARLSLLGKVRLDQARLQKAWLDYAILHKVWLGQAKLCQVTQGLARLGLVSSIGQYRPEYAWLGYSRLVQVEGDWTKLEKARPGYPRLGVTIATVVLYGGWKQTLDVRMPRRMFYHCATFVSLQQHTFVIRLIYNMLVIVHIYGRNRTRDLQLMGR